MFPIIKNFEFSRMSGQDVSQTLTYPMFMACRTCAWAALNYKTFQRR